MLSQESQQPVQQASKTVDDKLEEPKDTTRDQQNPEDPKGGSGEGKELGNKNEASEVIAPNGKVHNEVTDEKQPAEQPDNAGQPGGLLIDLANEKETTVPAVQDPKGKKPAASASLADISVFDEKSLGDDGAILPSEEVTPTIPAIDEAKAASKLDSTVNSTIDGLQNLKINTASVSDTEEAEKASFGVPRGAVEDNADADSRSEIASIMEQFQEGMGGPGEQEIMSPRMELASPLLSPSGHHPPRKSSLEPLNRTMSRDSFSQAHSVPPPRSSSLQGPAGPSSASIHSVQTQDRGSPKPPSQIFKPPPLESDPEPDLPFDFHRFLEQLRHRTADPVAKFLRSFLFEFGKRSWMVHEQVKIVSDFLAFITKKMAQCEVWRTVSDAEFDNAREGMEKLVMNRLYSQTFSPEIPPPEVVKRGRREEFLGGRRGQHQEDVERDEVLAQKVRIYGWVNEDHLDITPVGDKGKKFLKLAQQELLKIRNYRAPRDKVICVLNCCKVIFGFLRDSKSDQSADAFVPLLIYVVLHANPDHLVSNVQYILRFRNQDKLTGEAGYYISSLMGAVQFIENLDRTSLTISDEDFEANVEAAVKQIAERPPVTPEAIAASERERQRSQLLQSPPRSSRRAPSPHLVAEKSTLSQPEVTPRNSLEAERSTPRRSTSTKASRDSEKDGEDNAAVTGLLRTIQRPLSSIGRIFGDPEPPSPVPPSPTKASTAAARNAAQQPTLAQPPSPLPLQRRSNEETRRREEEGEQIRRLAAEDAAVRQASVEAEETRRVQRREFDTVVETLAGMFPGLDKEIIGDVVRGKEGNVGLAVDACLALSTT